MAQWKLSRRHPACVECDRPFEEGEAHFSRITFGPEVIERVDVCRDCWPEESDPNWIWWRARRQASTKRGLAVDWEVLTQIFERLGASIEELRAGGGSLPSMVAPPARTVVVQPAAEGAGEPDGASDAGESNPTEPEAEVESASEAASEPAADPEPPLDPIEQLQQLRYLLSLLLVRKRRLMLVRAVRRADGEALVLRRPRRKETVEVRAFDLEPERMDELRAQLQRLFEGEALREGDDEEGDEAEHGDADGGVADGEKADGENADGEGPAADAGADAADPVESARTD